jgi:hypothetical protein
MAQDLKWFANEAVRLAELIGAPASYLLTYGRSDDSARPHIEFNGARFLYVVVERGRELERLSAVGVQEILYRVFTSVTHQMAWDYECRHRRRSEDPRRQVFDVQLRRNSFNDP